MSIDPARCPACNKLILNAPHRCPPKWHCAIEEEDPAWHPIFAYMADDAAKDFASNIDCENDYSILQAGESGATIILVRKEGERQIQRFHVHAESRPYYWVREATPRLSGRPQSNND